MLKLVTFKPAFGTSNPSPFTVKADALLTMAGLDYTHEYGDLRKFPKQKLPVLRDGETLIPDSSFIQSHLEQQYGVNFDRGMSDQDKASASAFQRLIEDHLYFINLYFRWNEHAPALRDAFFGDIPSIMRGLIFNMVQKQVLKTLHLQGMGRHSRDELIELGRQDLQALSAQLGNQPFLYGERPTSIDASLYGALHNVIDCKLDTPLKTTALKYDNLVCYCERFSRTVYNQNELDERKVA